MAKHLGQRYASVQTPSRHTMHVVLAYHRQFVQDQLIETVLKNNVPQVPRVHQPDLQDL